MSSPPSDSEARIDTFTEATNASRVDALHYLDMTEWDVGAAIDCWLDGDGDDGDGQVEHSGPAATPAAAPPHPAPAPRSNPASAPAPARRGGIRTLDDLNSPAGQDHDHDDDDNDNDYFAGGEKSGLAVHGNPPPDRSNDLLQGLFDRARR
jgi:UBX domain-containing protein 1